MVWAPDEGYLEAVPYIAAVLAELEGVSKAERAKRATEAIELVAVVAILMLVGWAVWTFVYEAPGWVSDIRVSTDGRHIAFIDHPLRGDNNGNVKVVDASGKVLLTGPFAIRGLAWRKGQLLICAAMDVTVAP